VSDTDIRGGILLIAAKVVHVVAGFGLYFFLALAFTHAMGKAEGTAAFGIWGATFGVMNPVNMMAATATLQMMSRVVASGRTGVGAAFRSCARIQLTLIVALFGALQLAAGPIARTVLNDQAYVPYLRLASVIPVFYAWRALYQGYLNGVRRFREQAWLDIGASSSRMVLVLLGALAGLGTMGAIGGFVGSAAAVAVVAVVWIRPGGTEEQETVRAREILSFQAMVVAVTLATQYLLNVDLLAVKALGAGDPVVADRLAGYYTAAQKLAQVPMSVVVALAYLMFPYIASETTQADRARARRVVRQGMRTLLLLIVPCTAILASTARESLGLVFPSIARTAVELGDPAGILSGPLIVLALGYLLFALLQTATILITADGRPGLSATIAGAALVLAWFSTRALTPSWGLVGAAAGVAVAWAAGLAASGTVIVSRFGGFVSLRSATRIVLCGAAVYGLSLAFPVEGALLLAKDAALMLAFVALALVVRETSVEEIRSVVRQVLGRGPSPAPPPAGGES
jgi:O-antigen/teichoic acid export membrane protein